jgi:hypothetical protein
MAANGISKLPTKRERQLAKLALAALRRSATGRRPVLDITQLPTVYAIGDNNTNNVIDNPNIGGLILGRPWVSGVIPDPDPEPDLKFYSINLTILDSLTNTESLAFAIIFDDN